MASLKLKNKESVLQAIKEFDEIGQAKFLERYGFRKSRDFYLLYEGMSYDSKAIAGVAFGIENPELGYLRSAEFSGGKETVQRVLENLGFTVIDSKLTETIVTIENGIPSISKEQYMRALQTDGVLKDDNEQLLVTLYEMPSCQATATQLAKIYGYKDFAPINSIVGKLGKRIAQSLKIELPPRPSKNSPGWWQIICNGEYTDQGFAWRLRPELIDALYELGFLDDAKNLDLTEEAVSSVLPEGARRKVVVNAYERNRTARKLCIQYHGAVCKVCDLDFKSLYGSIGNGFIHVHHIKKLSDIGGEYKVDPKNDLVPVCPNCHAMIHRGGGSMPIEELRAIIANQASVDK